jgi:integrase
VGEKAEKGTVAIKVSHSRLQLVYRYRGQRKYLSLGLPDNRNNRKYAQSVASTIELDIVSGNYDITQAKYKLFEPEIKPERLTKTLELIELWDKYVSYKCPQVSQNTIANDYKQVERWLRKMPYVSIDNAIDIRAWLLQNTTPDSTRRILMQLSSCCAWAIKCNLLDCNPFEGMSRDLNIKKPKGEIEYFTQSERAQIIGYFQLHNTYYAPLVEFMFRTGCRPSEALALEWGDVSDSFDRIVFARALTSNEYGSKISVKDGLKTQASRTVPCGKTLTAFLRSIAPENRSATYLIFPSPKGKYIDIGNFGKRHWKPALEQLGLKYRSFYKVRHTAITHALDTLDAKDVAALVGNSADVIYKHYSGIKEGLTTPDF